MWKCVYMSESIELPRVDVSDWTLEYKKNIEQKLYYLPKSESRRECKEWMWEWVEARVREKWSEIDKQTDRQTDRQTGRWVGWSRAVTAILKASVVVFPALTSRSCWLLRECVKRRFILLVLAYLPPFFLLVSVWREALFSQFLLPFSSFSSRESV